MSKGWTDTTLTNLGRKQANLLGSRLNEIIDETEYVLFHQNY